MTGKAASNKEVEVVRVQCGKLVKSWESTVLESSKSSVWKSWKSIVLENRKKLVCSNTVENKLSFSVVLISQVCLLHKATIINKKQPKP